MNNKLTYIEARDKIWNAYFKDEIQPWDGEFCFCGNLNDKNTFWGTGSDPNNYYTYDQYNEMEAALFLGMERVAGDIHRSDKQPHPKYEDAVFNGMLLALEVLKQIHRERGEVIPEDEPLLTKRILQPV